MAERKSRAASRLMDKGLVFDGFENRLERIVDRKHETCGQLLQVTAGIHERRGVRQKIQAAHEVVELLRIVLPAIIASIQRFRLRHIVRHAPEHARRGFSSFAGRRFPEISAAQHRQRVGR